MNAPTITIQKVALYARVSTDEQKEGQTIDSQIAEIERFARERTWQIVGLYKDEGWSGALMARPDLDRLRDDARKGLFQAVVINDVDRLARDVAQLGIVKRDLERQRIQVVFRKLPTDSSPTSNLMVNILGSFAEFERELIADRTRRGRRHKIEVRKQYLGCNTSYGYRYIPKDQSSGDEAQLIVEPSEARIVQQMFDWVDSEGLSARRVMVRLIEQNVPTLKGRGPWCKSSVLRVLHNEMYCGLWHYGKHERVPPPEGASFAPSRKYGLKRRQRADWLPLELPQSLRIVPREQFDRVQSQLRRNLSFSPRNEQHRYLLKSLVRCGGCGGPYFGDPCHGKFYYRCGKRCGIVGSILESSLNEAITTAIRSMLVRPEVIIEPIKQLERADKDNRAYRDSARKAAQKTLGRIDNEERRLLDAYRTGVIDPAQLAMQLEKLNQQRAAAKAAADQPEGVQVMDTASETAVRDFCAEAGRNLNSFSHDEWQSLLREVIERITFFGDRATIEGKIMLPTNSEVDSELAIKYKHAAVVTASHRSYAVRRKPQRKEAATRLKLPPMERPESLILVGQQDCGAGTVGFGDDPNLDVA